MKLTGWTLLGLLFLLILYTYGRSWWHPWYLRVAGARTVSEVIDQYGPQAEQRLAAYFQAAGVDYPPQRISLLAFKDSDLLEVWAHQHGQSVRVHTYPILAASGVAGPKLREGDFQVPEGLYQIIAFNPNSAYHLSMKLNYPNAFDWQQARAEGRDQPGSDIFIHGKAVSVGCLAMGDPAIEELFTLVHAVGRSQVQVVIAPHDPALQPLLPADGDPPWVGQLYQDIGVAINRIRGD
jgi:hypothetical protein